MTNLEYDILDELYFLLSFEELKVRTDLNEAQLVKELINLSEKGWIRVLEQNSDEDVGVLDNFNKNYKNYNYLASKAGLLAHNSR